MPWIYQLAARLLSCSDCGSVSYHWIKILRNVITLMYFRIIDKWNWLCINLESSLVPMLLVYLRYIYGYTTPCSGNPLEEFSLESLVCGIAEIGSTKFLVWRNNLCLDRSWSPVGSKLIMILQNIYRAKPLLSPFLSRKQSKHTTKNSVSNFSLGSCTLVFLVSTARWLCHLYM